MEHKNQPSVREQRHNTAWANSFGPILFFHHGPLDPIEILLILFLFTFFPSRDIRFSGCLGLLSFSSLFPSNSKPLLNSPLNTMAKKATQIVSSSHEKTGADFLPLEGGPGRKLSKGDALESKATVVYIGRIPHGFYEDEMEGFFKQFGTIKRMKIARNRKTGKSKHYGFIEFEYPEVAKIVAECMHNYLLFEHLLQVQLIPPERVHPKLWKGINRHQDPVDFVLIERKRQNKQKTLEEYKKQIERILKRDRKRKKKIDAAGIDYECPEIVGADQPALKKIKLGHKE